VYFRNPKSGPQQRRQSPDLAVVVEVAAVVVVVVVVLVHLLVVNYVVDYGSGDTPRVRERVVCAAMGKQVEEDRELLFPSDALTHVSVGLLQDTPQNAI
jgi:hypothetical protein